MDPARFEEGCVVELAGLGKVELNGKRGTVVGPKLPNGRWPIVLIKSEGMTQNVATLAKRLSIKPGNLLLHRSRTATESHVTSVDISADSKQLSARRVALNLQVENLNNMRCFTAGIDGDRLHWDTYGRYEQARAQDLFTCSNVDTHAQLKAIRTLGPLDVVAEHGHAQICATLEVGKTTLHCPNHNHPMWRVLPSAVLPPPPCFSCDQPILGGQEVLHCYLCHSHICRVCEGNEDRTRASFLKHSTKTHWDLQVWCPPHRRAWLQTLLLCAQRACDHDTEVGSTSNARAKDVNEGAIAPARTSQTEHGATTTTTTDSDNSDEITLHWLNKTGIIQLEAHRVFVKQRETVRDFVMRMRDKFGTIPAVHTRCIITSPAGPVYNIVRIAQLDEVLARLILGYPGCGLHIEEVPTDQTNVNTHVSKLVKIQHICQRPHGVPFFLLAIHNEPVADLRARIQAYIGAEDEEFAGWKLGFARRRSPKFAMLARLREKIVTAAYDDAQTEVEYKRDGQAVKLAELEWIVFDHQKSHPAIRLTKLGLDANLVEKVTAHFAEQFFHIHGVDVVRGCEVVPYHFRQLYSACETLCNDFTNRPKDQRNRLVTADLVCCAVDILLSLHRARGILRFRLCLYSSLAFWW